ncbi:hypothetical protein PHLGIDRAFT_130274 [Phlebiopsis gigantea 11061_1 CR5-6]|uniref:Uncharacterized protein n=1 Tax=Phlebiopsis gigantea (strain 11061_1 CR5-6) TaxID=745531 RepID=A0A0C3S1P7_PHLG1|nr:hypothetical protein PHLGIDRAFT_130274 [Phlebiopsis gigantea 11061_1 CR5-6]
MRPQHKAYAGMTRSLVVAIDVGTTYSGISYAVLDPGQVPRIQSVSRYPGRSTTDFKVPSIVYYSEDGAVRAIGAETLEPGFELKVQDESLTRVEWFKLHLCPSSLQSGDLAEADLQPLPFGKKAGDVFADMLRYLYACVHRFITETHGNGTSLWASVQSRISFVLSHPNGWEGPQQAKLRQAAVRAGLVPNDAAGHARIHFVTEGEASLHFCVNSGLAADYIQDGSRVMIVDAGGGTVDLSSYKFVSTNPLTVEEIAAPGCILQGSTRVNARALTYLKSKLHNSSFGNDEDIGEMMLKFEESTKPTFKDDSEQTFIKFGGWRNQDASVNIRNGQLTLEGEDVAQFFQPSLMGIVAAIRKQRLAATESVNVAFLVGGFAASPWLFSHLQDVLSTMDIDLSRPDGHTNKAVAEGAVSFFLSSFVTSRIAKYTYGVTCSRSLDWADPECVARSHTAHPRPSGRLYIPDGFHSYIEKGSKIRDNEEINHNFYREAMYPTSLNCIETSITCYRGDLKSLRWKDEDPMNFASLCTIRADTSGTKPERKEGSSGSYYTQHYDIVILCGLTELKAQIRWCENGVEKYGEAQVIYDDDDDAELIF